MNEKASTHQIDRVLKFFPVSSVKTIFRLKIWKSVIIISMMNDRKVSSENQKLLFHRKNSIERLELNITLLFAMWM